MSDTFEHFFKRNYRDVEQRIRAAGASNDIAAEATQEAFVRAYQRWWRISHYGNPASWVQRVAINCRIDLERDRQRQSKVVRPLAVEAVEVDDDPDPRVEAAVDSLPPRQQAAVRAVYADGMTAVETADELGISPGAVRFHLNRARATLRPMLSSETTGQEV